jgi:virginiamycin B lyase
MTPSGVLTEFDPFAPGGVPYGITAGVDGNLWLTENGANKVARMKTDGTVTEFALQRPNSHPFEIISGSDGNLWITERGNNGTASLARVTTSGVVTEFPNVLPGLWGITAGPDGRVWFAEGGSGKLGAISSTGVVEQFPLPGPARSPTWITTGADGNLWTTDATNQQLIRFKP